DFLRREAAPLPIGIVLRCPESLPRIRRVVPSPDLYGGPAVPSPQLVRLRQQRHQGHVPAIAPSVDANARDIRKTLRAEPAHPFDLVADLISPRRRWSDPSKLNPRRAEPRLSTLRTTKPCSASICARRSTVCAQLSLTICGPGPP